MAEPLGPFKALRDPVQMPPVPNKPGRMLLLYRGKKIQDLTDDQVIDAEMHVHAAVRDGAWPSEQGAEALKVIQREKDSRAWRLAENVKLGTIDQEAGW